MIFIHLDETHSTNDFLRQFEAEQPADITCVTAEFQSSGRGQRGNSWESERGKNLLFSLLVHPSLSVSHIFSLSEICALSIHDALSAYTDDIEVKWPNDIYWHDKKIAGILIETSLSGKQIADGIIGVGVNINQTEFLSDAPNPVSLQLITGAPTDRDEVLQKIAQHFEDYMAQLHEGDFTSIHERYMAILYRREGFHPYRDEQGCFSAEIADVQPSGHLILRDTEGHDRRYAFKEVEFLIR